MYFTHTDAGGSAKASKGTEVKLQPYNCAGSSPTTFWIDDISFDYVTESEEIHSSNNIMVWPNPTRGIVHVNSNERKKIVFSVFDIYGKRITEGIADDVVDLSAYNPGIYFISIDSEEGRSEVFRIIKY